MSTLAAIDSLADARSMYISQIACFGSLTFTLYDAAITLDDEAAIIYPLPKSSSFRWLYLFTKYLAIIVQIINLVTTLQIHSKYPITDVQICRTWFSARVVVSQVLLISIELIMIVRVWTLCLHNRGVGILLALVLICELSLMIKAAKTLSERTQFNYACLILRAPSNIFSFKFGSNWGSMFNQVIILFLTFYYRFAIRVGGRNVPVLGVMIYDGSKAFLVMSTVLIVPMVGKIFHLEMASISMSVFVSIISSTGCRIIINMLDTRIDPPEFGDSEMLSSAFDIETFEQEIEITIPKRNVSETDSLSVQ